MAAKTPQTKGGYARVETLDDDEVDVGIDSTASIQAHWRSRFGWVARATYGWVTPIFRLGMQRQINLEDLPTLDTGPLYWQQLDLEPMLVKTKAVLADVRSSGTTGVRASLMWVFCGRVFISDLMLASACDTTVQVINLVNPLFMREFIAFMETPGAPVADGIRLAVWLFLLTAVMQPIQNLSFLIGGTTGAKQRAVMNALLFQKALRLSNEARQGSSVGQIVNLMSNDANRFQEFGWFAISMWMVPVYLAVAIGLLINMLGASALSGIVVLVISLAINKRMMLRLHKLRTTQLHQTDDRVKQTNEAVLGIRVVKLYTWEQSIEDRIAKLRAVELERIRSTERLMALNRFMFFSIPVITAVVTFLTFTMLGNKMDASLIFSSMALFNLIQEYLQQLPRAVAIVTQVLVAQGRIKAFLDSTELEAPADDVRTEAVAADGKGEIALENVAVKWEKAASVPNLAGLNMRAHAGKLVAIVGSVGSGKSTVLAAMLGEMHQVEGRVVSKGTIAYCAQQPWLISGTLRDNVLHGTPFDEQRYHGTISACGLLEDLEQLPGGDQTVIGEWRRCRCCCCCRRRRRRRLLLLLPPWPTLGVVLTGQMLLPLGRRARDKYQVTKRSFLAVYIYK
jgi:ABC-type multidrug transport system fused ATPase/permease subunit